MNHGTAWVMHGEVSFIRSLLIQQHRLWVNTQKGPERGLLETRYWTVSALRQNEVSVVPVGEWSHPTHNNQQMLLTESIRFDSDFTVTGLCTFVWIHLLQILVYHNSQQNNHISELWENFNDMFSVFICISFLIDITFRRKIVEKHQARSADCWNNKGTNRCSSLKFRFIANSLDRLTIDGTKIHNNKSVDLHQHLHLVPRHPRTDYAPVTE